MLRDLSFPHIPATVGYSSAQESQRLSQLLQEARSGNRTSETELLQRITGLVFPDLVLILGKDPITLDLLQETLIYALNTDFDGGSALVPHLRLHAKNLARELIRARSARRGRMISETDLVSQYDPFHRNLEFRLDDFTSPIPDPLTLLTQPRFPFWRDPSRGTPPFYTH